MPVLDHELKRNDPVLDQFDRAYSRLIRQARQQKFERSIPPPPIIGSAFDPNKQQRHRSWPPEVVRAFWNADVIRERR
jgi:hypothetical protein